MPHLPLLGVLATSRAGAALSKLATLTGVNQLSIASPRFGSTGEFESV